jgi:hypothetical protein
LAILDGINVKGENIMRDIMYACSSILYKGKYYAIELPQENLSQYLTTVMGIPNFKDYDNLYLTDCTLHYSNYSKQLDMCSDKYVIEFFNMELLAAREIFEEMGTDNIEHLNALIDTYIDYYNVDYTTLGCIKEALELHKHGKFCCAEGCHTPEEVGRHVVAYGMTDPNTQDYLKVFEQFKHDCYAFTDYGYIGWTEK